LFSPVALIFVRLAGAISPLFFVRIAELLEQLDNLLAGGILVHFVIPP